ncbi:MAG: bifunctional homocysteine S-methyltransferase/methylenetetrahydrofolate reductase [Deltaproteobacteria bacterium]|nr:bifunctional homocysteine S-methyltransferase/methylenetetrahydrofolate reductase [Deltaproteobacteria bacterium]
MQPFLAALHDRTLLADGAMGTQIYARGIFINRCFDELNLVQPDLIRGIHQDYLAAGADLLETNTFAANRYRLEPYGLAEKVQAINETGARLAKAVAGTKAYVAGAVGPLGMPLEPLGRLARADAQAAFCEQIAGLAQGGVDCLILETFLVLEELELAYRAAREVTDLPVIAQMAFRFRDTGEVIGLPPAEAAKRIAGWGAEVVGTNCVSGPEGVLQAIQQMRAVSDVKLSAMPNAGLPQVVEGRMIYLATPEYMGEYARRLVQSGANIVGGCCGTTPGEIAEMRKFLKSITPSPRVQVAIAEQAPPSDITPIPLAQKSVFAAKLEETFQVSVEVDPPRGLDPTKVIEGARFLKANGVDAVNIADGARAIARMSPMALATLIKDAVGIETIIHYCCRDRNLLGMQMDLIGANALGLHNMLIITGDPPKMGNFPHATGVFDVDAIGLLHFARMLNHGLDLGGRSLGEPASLVLGCGCNPGAINLDLEVERYRKKIAAGAEFVFSQPVYDPDMLATFLARTADVPPIPFFAGILPLASLKNAEFLHNEVPGMQIPAAIMDRMRTAATKEAQRREGIRIAQEALAAAKRSPRVHGAYMFPPFGSYEAVVEVMKVL